MNWLRGAALSPLTHATELPAHAGMVASARMHRISAERITRVLAAGTAAGLAICLFTAAAVANGLAAMVAVPVAIAVWLATTFWLTRHVPARVVDAVSLTPTPRWLIIVWWMLAAVALVETTRLAAYMTHRPPPQAFAWTHSKFMRNHSCGTSYYEGALNVTRVDNVYDIELYRPSNEPAREVEGFRPDPYQYPPPFLLIAAPIATTVGSYVGFRGVWFAMMGSAVLAGFWGLSAWIGGALGGRLAWLSLAAWAAIPVQMTLQIGNFQLGAIAIAVLGMVSIRKGKICFGAAMIGIVTAAKVFPGVLLLYLLVRKEFRAVAVAIVTGVVCIALCALFFPSRSLMLFATYQLPRLDTGDALPGLVMKGPIAINASIPGIVIKLQLIGVYLSRTYLSIAGWVFSAIVVALTVRAARWRLSRQHEAAVWLALLGLMAMRSPFLPHEYGTFPGIWIATITLACAHKRAVVVACLVALAAFNIYLPGDLGIGPGWLALAAGCGQAAAVFFFAWVLGSQRWWPSAAHDAC